MAGGGLKVGDLYVAVTASIGEALTNLGKLVQEVERVAKKVKAVAEPMAQVGAMAAAGIAGTVAVAAKSNAALSTELDRLKKLVLTLGADIGSLFEPLVKRLTQAFSKFVGYLQSLPAPLKRNAAELVGFVAVGGVTVGLLGRVAGVVGAAAEGFNGLLLPALKYGLKGFAALGPAVGEGLTALKAFGAINVSTALGSLKSGVLGLGESLKGLAGSGPSVWATIKSTALSFGSLLLPVAAVAAAIAALVLLAGAIYSAWDDVSGGLGDLFRGLGDTISGWARKVGEVVSAVWDTLKGFILKGVTALLDVLAKVVSKLAEMYEPVARVLGMDNVAGTLKELQGLTGERLLSDMQKGAAILWDGAKRAGAALADGAAGVAKDVGEGVAYGLKTSMKGVKDMTAPLVQKLEGLAGRVKGMLGFDLSKAPDAKLHLPYELEAEPSKVGRMELPQSLRDLAAGKDPVAEAVRKMNIDALKRFADAAKEAGAALKDKFTAALGALPGILETFQQGVTASSYVRKVKGTNGQEVEEVVEGTAIAGAGAVALQLFTQSRQFQQVMQTVSGVIQVVADFLGQLAEPLGPLIGALGLIVTALLPPLQPILDLVAHVLQMITPPLVMVGQLLVALQPLLTLAVQAFTLISEPLRLLGGVVLRALFEVLRWVGIAILTVVKALADAWNSIVKVINGFIDKAKEIYKSVYGPLIGDKGKELIDQVYGGLKVGTIDTSGIQSGLNTLRDATWSTAAAQAAQAAETYRNVAAMKDATEALTNVPSAWKVALARYNSQDAQESPLLGGGSAGSAGSSSTVGMPTQADIDAATAWQAAHMPGAVTTPERSGGTVSAMSQPTTSVTYQIVGYDIDRAIDATQKNERRRQADEAYRRGGTTVPGVRLSYGV